MFFKIILAIYVLLHPFFAQSQETMGISASYHSRGCFGGVGFCTETENLSLNKKSNASLKKLAYNKIGLILNKKDFIKSEMFIMEHTKIFIVSGDVNLKIDQNILQKLKIDPLFSQIKPGEYPMEISEKEVLVIFTLDKK